MILFSNQVKNMKELEEIVEPDKCLWYERYEIGEVDENKLSNGAKEL